MPRKVTAYECEWNCGKNLRKTKAAVSRHETACLLNPARQSCATCRYDDPGSAGDWDEPPEGPQCIQGYRPDNKQCIVLCPRHRIDATIKEDPNA